MEALILDCGRPSTQLMRDSLGRSMEQAHYNPALFLTVPIAITIVGGIVSATGMAIERWLGAIGLWSAAVLTFLALLLYIRTDFAEAQAEGQLAGLAISALVVGGGCTIVPAFGIWRARRTTPTLSLWREAWAGLLAIYLYFGGVLVVGVLIAWFLRLHHAAA